MAINWFKYSSPATFYPLAGRLAVWFGIASVLLLVVGLYMSFFVAPTDYKQGEGYRIIYIHVPAAWMSMFIYFVMACWAAAGIIWRTRLSSMMALALAPTGAMFTFIALWTGSLWGKPMWGTWWVWDARIVSELILLFLFIGFMALNSAIDDARRAARASGVLAIVGIINLPIIYYSVQWWNTLHQGATIKFSTQGVQSEMSEIMLYSMLVMTFACWFYTIAVVMTRVRRIILEREGNSTWVKEMLQEER